MAGTSRLVSQISDFRINHRACARAATPATSRSRHFTSQTNSKPVFVSLGSRAKLSLVHQQVVYAAYPQTLWLPVVGGAVNEKGSAIGRDDQGPPPVFISYATADRTEALKVCEAIERRGTKCWISMDVPPGANIRRRSCIASGIVAGPSFPDAANTSNDRDEPARQPLKVPLCSPQSVEPAMHSPTNCRHVSGSTR
jgi:hypothetical protein